MFSCPQSHATVLTHGQDICLSKPPEACRKADVVTDRRLLPVSLEFDVNFMPTQVPMLQITHKPVILYLLGVGGALGPALR